MGKRISYAKNSWYDMFLFPFGDGVALKFLVALFFLIAINSLLRSLTC